MKESKRSQNIVRSGKKRQKESSHTANYWITWILLIVLFFLFIFIFGENGLVKIGELRKLNMVLTSEINELITKNEMLTREIKGLREDPFFIERVARQELDLVKPGEIVYHFIPTESNDKLIKKRDR